MSREMTNSEAIANLNHIYGIVSPDIQRSLDVAFKALEERPQGEWIEQKNYPYQKCRLQLGYECNQCGTEHEYRVNFCPNCGAKMKGGAE